MEQIEFHGPTTKPDIFWQQVEPGIDELVLNEDAATGRKTLLQRWQPGAANVPRVFVHDYNEEIYIVEGDLTDTRLRQSWGKGAYAFRKPGMKHGPFTSNKGCLMYITCAPPK